MLPRVAREELGLLRSRGRSGSLAPAGSNQAHDFKGLDRMDGAGKSAE